MGLKRKESDDITICKRFASEKSLGNHLSEIRLEQNADNENVENEFETPNEDNKHVIEQLKSRIEEAKNILEKQKSILQKKTATTNYICGRLRYYAADYEAECTSLLSTIRQLMLDVAKNKAHIKDAQKDILKQQLEYEDKSNILQCLTNENTSLKADIELQSKKNNEFKEGMLTVMDARMRSSLICIICNDIMIEPTVTNCGHTFCSTCIFEKILVGPSCFLCSTPINSLTRSLLFDEFIEGLLQYGSSKEKEERNRKRQGRLSIRDHTLWDSWFHSN